MPSSFSELQKTATKNDDTQRKLSILMQYHLIGLFQKKKYQDVRHPKKANLLLSENYDGVDKLKSSLVHYSDNISSKGPLQTILPVML